MPANFKLDVDADGIALVTWDMPGRTMNVIDLGVIAELAAIVEQVANDAAIKGAVITSGKETFCAGADLTLLETLARTFAEMVKGQGEEAAAASCSKRAESSRSSTGASRPAASRGWPPSTAPRWAAGSSSPLPVTIALRRRARRPASGCPRSRSGCSPAPAARSGSRA